MTEIEQIKLNIKEIENLIDNLPKIYTTLTQWKQLNLIMKNEINDFIYTFQEKLDELNLSNVQLDSSIFVTNTEWKQLDNIRLGELKELDEKFDENTTMLDNQIEALKLQVNDLIYLINNVDLLQLQNISIHLNNFLNPHHVTKTQVGLSNVENFGVASEAEAQAGTATDKYMTPFSTYKTMQALTNTIGIDGGTF